MNDLAAVQSISKTVPFTTAVYPNSENIRPPIKKERTRVVEPSTRSDVKMGALKEWHAKRSYWEKAVQDTRVQEYLNESSKLNPPSIQKIDIKA